MTDAATGEGVPFASVAITGSVSGGNTDFDGYYAFSFSFPADSVFVTSVGYRRSARKIVHNQVEQVVDFQIAADVHALREVVVRAGENPAWAIIRRVVDRRKVNNPDRQTASQYESYTKTQIDVNKLTDKFRNRKSVRQITDIIDQFEGLKGDEGETVVPVFISESVSDVFLRTDPMKKKEIIRKTKVSGIGMDDSGLVSQVIGSSFQQYNFYKDWLRIVEKDFVSPISDSWKLYYEYFLSDSVKNGEVYDYKIEFEPKRKQDLAFLGSMWIDGETYALTRIDVSILKETNINYIDNLRIQQEYDQPEEGSAWLPFKTRVVIDVEQINKTAPGLLLKFYTTNSNFLLDQPKHPRFYDTAIELSDDYMDFEPDFWQKKRPENLSDAEKLSFQAIDSISNVPMIRTYTEILNVFVNGYKNIDRLNVDFGPYLYAYAFNNVEGHRLRLGFKTDEEFSKKWIFSGYGAYGFKDRQWKYRLGVDHIFSRKPWTTGGIHYQYDIERLGLTRENLANSSIFGAFSRYGNFRRAYMQRDGYLYLKREIAKGLTHQITLRNRTFDPLFQFLYRTDLSKGDQSPLGSFYRTTELEFETRLAHRETFLQNNNERISLGNDNAPIVSIRYAIGLKGMLGGDFYYHKLRLNVKQSFRLGFIGRTTYEANFGYIPSQLPYPMLYTPLGNESWFYVENAFNLMNYFEFVSDRYATLRLEHDDNGFVLNRIPAIRRLKLRLLATGRLYYGDLSPSNRNITPTHDALGNEMETFKTLGRRPYMEVGYGLNNIFRVGRIDFVHRLTYRNEPSVSKFGVKVSFWFNI
ncbi:DUF5686 and carboxypeptidase-like regulatory domain-containing protein [Ravibacter arvi]|uniref:DUF5686 and carboxypeptidase-like regulatory domain-containing protein n=1 Tax=Ravibacter arvi TaxID=2051041 RepID=A0ABP8MBA2_9BACT